MAGFYILYLETIIGQMNGNMTYHIYGVYQIYKHVWEETQMTVWFVHSYTIFCI